MTELWPVGKKLYRSTTCGLYQCLCPVSLQEVANKQKRKQQIDLHASFWFSYALIPLRPQYFSNSGVNGSTKIRCVHTMLHFQVIYLYILNLEKKSQNRLAGHHHVHLLNSPDRFTDLTSPHAFLEFCLKQRNISNTHHFIRFSNSRARGL